MQASAMPFLPGRTVTTSVCVRSPARKAPRSPSATRAATPTRDRGDVHEGTAIALGDADPGDVELLDDGNVGPRVLAERQGPERAPAGERQQQHELIGEVTADRHAGRQILLHLARG